MPYSPPGYDPGVSTGSDTPAPAPAPAFVGPWAPVVWPGLVWPGLVWPGRVGVVVAVASARDWDILVDVRDRLDALGIFDRAHVAGEEHDPRLTAADGLAAVVSPAGFDDTDDAMSGSEADVLHTCRFRVTIAGRSNSQAGRVREIDRVAMQAMNAVNGKSLADISFPAMTSLRRKSWDRPDQPGSSATLDGEAVYLVPGYAAHNVADGAELVE